MPGKTRVVSFGVGVIGSAVVKTMVEKKSDWIDIVGAIDSDPSKTGKDLGVVAGLDKSCGVLVSNKIERTLAETKPDIVVHTTSSYLSSVEQQLIDIATQGVDIVSSCEELSYASVVDQKIANELDSIAKENDVSILGTGINPGFVMDALPIALTAPCISINSIHVARQMNAATRRIPFQKKIGAGMKPDEFKDALSSGKISGHVGLSQSISMLADSIGWKLEQIEVRTPEPVILDRKVSSDWIAVEAGMVAGTRQKALGIIRGKFAITYDFAAYIGAPEEFDAVEISGNPTVSFKSNPCINGDAGTIAMLINMIPRVLEAPPGLLTMADLRLPRAANMPLSV